MKSDLFSRWHGAGILMVYDVELNLPPGGDARCDGTRGRHGDRHARRNGAGIQCIAGRHYLIPFETESLMMD